jgi:hypothetical protein
MGNQTLQVTARLTAYSLEFAGIPGPLCPGACSVFDIARSRELLLISHGWGRALAAFLCVSVTWAWGGGGGGVNIL